MKSLIPSVSTPEGQKGIYRIERKAIIVDPIHRLQDIFHGGRTVPDGTYTFLYRGGTLVMSDTPDEKRDHYEAVTEASGECLIAGLGIGMVLNAIALKPEVTHIDVVELSQDVIDLVAPYYENLYPGKITFHCASIFDWIPPKDKKYNMAWFDIWDNLCTDNLKEMATLHRKYGKKAVWKGSWGKDYLQYQKRQENRNNWRY